MVPQWLTRPVWGKAALFILLTLALASPAGSQWKTVSCGSDFGEGGDCCQWCFFWGCNGCEWVVDPLEAGAR